MGIDAGGFILAMLVIGGSAIAAKSSYYILKFMAGMLWWAFGLYWIANPPVVAGTPADVIMIVLLFFIGIAFVIMPFWFTKYNNGQESGGKIRIPFFSPTEDEEESERVARSLPTRAERSAAYRERVNRSLSGRR